MVRLGVPTGESWLASRQDLAGGNTLVNKLLKYMMKTRSEI
jgi:hypothetical protein